MTTVKFEPSVVLFYDGLSDADLREVHAQLVERLREQITREDVCGPILTGQKIAALKEVAAARFFRQPLCAGQEASVPAACRVTESMSTAGDTFQRPLLAEPLDDKQAGKQTTRDKTNE